jgi:hypothetical protein
VRCTVTASGREQRKYGMSGAIPLLKAKSGRIMDEPVLAAERWIASGKLAQIAGCFFDAVQGNDHVC